MSKICLIFNTPSLYRKLIYTKIDQQFDCVWYFGDFDNKVKVFDTSCLQHPVHFLHVKNPGRSWSSTEGVIPLLKNKEFERYLMTGEVRDITTWLVLILKNFFYRKKKIYFWTHGWYGKESRLERLIKHIFYKMVDGVFLYGNHAKEMMLQEGFKGNNLYVIHNSLDYNAQLEIRKKIKSSSLYQDHFKNSNKNIIFLGRLTTVKRLDMLLDVVSMLKEKGELYNITFVGDGLERIKLEQKASCLEIKKQVWFYGACYDEQKNAEFVYNADLCVSPGNVGLTAMHMLMFGTPVITHDCFELQMPEFEAIVPYKTGLFFKYGDVNNLCIKIQEWFRVNGELRDYVRQSCYREIDTQWTPDFQMSVLQSVLNRE
jgi:glycosyltransferase involved in cell wall biosynthesis